MGEIFNLLKELRGLGERGVKGESGSLIFAPFPPAPPHTLSPWKQQKQSGSDRVPAPLPANPKSSPLEPKTSRDGRSEGSSMGRRGGGWGGGRERRGEGGERGGGRGNNSKSDGFWGCKEVTARKHGGKQKGGKENGELRCFSI